MNSENDKNLQADQWRVHQLEKSLADPKHDYHKFGTGNRVGNEWKFGFHNHSFLCMNVRRSGKVSHA